MNREQYLSSLENTVQNCDFISRLSSGMDIKIYTDMLEQQNTALQARIKQLEEENENYGNTILELKSNDFGDKIEKEYQEFGG